MTPRDELLNAIDRLAAAGRSRDPARVEKRRQDARALVLLHLSTTAAADALKCPHCLVSYRSRRRLDEHVYYVHDGPKPDHWRDEDAAR